MQPDADRALRGGLPALGPDALARRRARAVAAGPPREIYITDPREVAGPADYQTEVIWPIR